MLWKCNIADFFCKKNSPFHRTSVCFWKIPNTEELVPIRISNDLSWSNFDNSQTKTCQLSAQPPPPPQGGHSGEVWVEVCRWDLPTLFCLGQKQLILLPCLIASGTNRHPVQDTKWWIYIPCLRLKTQESIPCSVAQTCVGQIKKSPTGHSY